MALYYDAASILSSTSTSGSLKSRIYSNTNLRAKPAQVYALISETAKRDDFLKEVLDGTDLLKDEPKLTPLLSLLLCHDHLFSKGGIAAPARHPLRLAVERHKVRLQSEFTRARLRRKCGSIDVLKKLLDQEKGASALVGPHPRWVRINTIKARSGVEEVIRTFTGRVEKASLDDIPMDDRKNGYHQDKNIPHLLALSPTFDATGTEAYRHGQIILQDKASCFPAHLLLGGEDLEQIGDMIDGCAAPGNKTTHLAAIAADKGVRGRIYACERDPVRSKTLEKMVTKAGATSTVEVLARQDFLALNPEDDKKFANVTHLLLDPSCSGSGILGREDVPKLALPDDPRARTSRIVDNAHRNKAATTTAKKRKRNETNGGRESIELQRAEPDNIGSEDEAAPLAIDHDRLEKLSNLQTRIIEHAMKFPRAIRITYSTCSIHEQENESVVSRVLNSKVARTRGWRVLRREEQVEGMKRWKHRGVQIGTAHVKGKSKDQLSQEELEACIRCSPNDGEGTMGFFVCGFVRETGAASRGSQGKDETGQEDNENEEEEWSGFD